LRQVKGLQEAEMARLVARRGRGYQDLAALRRDAGISQGALDRLARADAFGSLALDRRGALWRAIGLDRTGHEPDLPPLFAWAAGRTARAEPEIALPRMTLGQDVAEDYANLRLSLRAHPLALLRRFLPRRTLRARQLADIENGRPVAVAGLTLVRQRPGTASGVIFITLEDETGVANLVVWPKTFERFRRVVLGAQLLVVQGPLQKEGLVIHVIAERLVDRSDLLRRLAATDPAFRSPLARADHAKSGSPPDPRDPFWRPRDLDHFRSHPHIYRGVLEPPEARPTAQPRPLDPRAAGFRSRNFR
jgi:error-prone DNA polymerase